MAPVRPVQHAAPASGKGCRARLALACAALLAPPLVPPLGAESAFEMVPPSRSSLPEPRPLEVAKGVPVFASPSPSPKVSRQEPGSGKVEVRGYSAATPDAPFDPSAVYRAASLPRNNDNPATDGHHRTLVGFYAVQPYRESTAPRRLRFEIRLEVPGDPPRDSVIEMYAPADGKIRSIPAHVSLPINRLTRPGRYTMSWSVIDQQSGDWDTATASFSKANVEKVAEVDPRSLPTPPPVARPASADGFATTPPPPRRPQGEEDFVTAPPVQRKKDDDSRFVTTPPTPQSPKAPGTSHQGFRTKADAAPPSKADGFKKSKPTPQKKK